MTETRFQEWLRDVEVEIGSRRLPAALRIALQLAQNTYGCRVRVMRKSDGDVRCIATASEGPVPSMKGPGIPLSSSGEFYLVAEGWGRLCRYDQARLTLYLRRLVHERREEPVDARSRA